MTSDIMNPANPIMIRKIPTPASGDRTNPCTIQSTSTDPGMTSMVPILRGGGLGRGGDARYNYRYKTSTVITPFVCSLKFCFKTFRVE